MRRYVLATIALLPLLLSCSHAAQNWTFDQNTGPWAFGGDESEKSSYLGVDIVDVTTERLGALKLKEENGVEVTMVDQDAPAGKAGIKEHDVILTMNGTTIESGVQLRRMIHETPPGRMVTLGLSRDGQPVTVKVQLADKHKAFSMVTPKSGDYHINVPEIQIPDIDIPSMNMVVVTSSARSGLMVENITPQLGDFFGVKDGNGVLVRSVEKGSRAEKAGFRAGDVIIKVNGESVHDTSDFTHAVKSRSGNSVSVGVVREKRDQTLSLSLPDRKEQSDLIEENSFDEEPLMQAESAFALHEALAEIAKVRPQIELAIETSRRTMEKTSKEVSQELCKQQKEMRKSTERQQEETKRNVERLRLRLEQLREDWL